ncbi:MAG: OsmC family protein [Chloroflexota bacterium]
MTTRTLTKTCTNLDLEAFTATREAVLADPSVGRGSFTTVSRWQDAARARTTARSFSIETDEPAPLGGTDQAVDPMELLLASIGTCLTIGWVTQAAKREVDFRDLSIEVRGEYDLRGYLAIDEDVRPGFTEIAYEVRVDSDADPAVLDEIRKAAERTSPMYDNVLRGAPISHSVSTV